MPEPQVGSVYKPNILRGMISTAPIIFFIIFVFASTIISSGLSHSLAANLFGIILSLIFLIVLLIPVLIIYLSLKVQSYELRDDGVFVRKGIISKTQALVLYSQVQDVQESQGLLENIFGIGNLRIVTMSQKVPVMLVSLDESDMKGIKDFVLSMTNRTKPLEVSEINGDLPEKLPYDIHPLKKGLVSIVISGIIFAIVFNLVFFWVSYTQHAYFDFVLVEILLVVLLSIAFFVVLIGSVITQISFRLKIAGESIVIGSEFLSRNFVNLPYEKVQDIGLRRGLFDRLLHMTSIKIETGEAFVPTASRKSSIPLNSISNLYEKDALELRGVVLTKSGVEDLETDNLRVKFPLENIKPLKKSVSTAFWMFVAIGILTVIVYSLEPFWGGILIFLLPIIVFLIRFVYEIFYFKSYCYSDNDEILILRKGVFTITEVTVPYDKIQNIFVNRDIFDRIFGLYDVHLSTVGIISQMGLHIDGVSKENSENLKNLFSRRVP